jgi:transcriptional regulator with XRE-family HTH domain
MFNRRTAPASLRRFRAAAAIQGLTVAQLAERCGVSDSHLRAIALGERSPSERVVIALKRELGQEGWAFGRGQRDCLPMPGSADHHSSTGV